MNEALFIPKDCFSFPDLGVPDKKLTITGDLQSGTLKKGMRARIGDQEVTVIGIEIFKKGLSEILSCGEKAGVMVEPITQEEYKAHIKQLKSESKEPSITFYE